MRGPESAIENLLTLNSQIFLPTIESVYTDLQKIAETGNIENPYRYLGLRD